jgi:membrane associated rhomboid family serine protease
MQRIEIYRTPHERSCRERALVLRSQGIPFAQDTLDGFHVLLVEPLFASWAADQLRRYEEENHGQRLRPVLPAAAGGQGAASLGFALLLGCAGLFQFRAAFGLDWTALGLAEAGPTRLAEPWRAATALTLHADPAHLFSNMLFGAAFVYLLAHGHGGGLALLAALATGVLGNWSNAWLQDPGHLSLGASTAVFGAIGCLCASEARRRHLLLEPRARRLAPFGIALVLLAYLGASGEHTDILAHVSGLAWGLALGIALPALYRRAAGPLAQGVSAAAALLLVLLAWGAALAR